jgi:hypothetical protein
MYFKPLNDEDRQKNQRLDQINHAPYFTIFMISAGLFLLFTISVLLGVF